MGPSSCIESQEHLRLASYASIATKAELTIIVSHSE